MIYRELVIAETQSYPLVQKIAFVCLDGEHAQECAFQDHEQLPEFAKKSWRQISKKRTLSRSEKSNRILVILNEEAYRHILFLLTHYPELTDTEKAEWVKITAVRSDYGIQSDWKNTEQLKFFKRLCVRVALEVAKSELEEWFREKGIDPRIEVGTIHRDILRVAPIKYHEKHFREIDKLIKKGLKQKTALDDVSSKYGFNREGLEKQYRKRWLNERIKPKSS